MVDVYCLSLKCPVVLDHYSFLLSVAEYLGQARALGMGVSVRGECSAVMRIQLNFLHVKISSCIDGQWPVKLRRDIEALLNVIHASFILGGKSITPTDYFSLATCCIDQLLMQFDQEIDKLKFVCAD